MRQAREILRQKYELKHSHREVARSLGVGVGTIGAALKRARDRGLSSWDDVVGLSLTVEVSSNVRSADERTPHELEEDQERDAQEMLLSFRGRRRT